jgi:hypothetical protein
MGEDQSSRVCLVFVDRDVTILDLFALGSLSSVALSSNR